VFLASNGHTNEELLEAVKTQQANNPDGCLGMDTVGVILATLEYDVFLQVFALSFIVLCWCLALADMTKDCRRKD